MVCRCDFVALREDLHIQSLIIIIFRSVLAYGPHNRQELSNTIHRILEENPVLFGEKSGMKCDLEKNRYFWRKIRHFRRNIRYRYRQDAGGLATPASCRLTTLVWTDGTTALAYKFIKCLNNYTLNCNVKTNIFTFTLSSKEISTFQSRILFCSF
jgi:hypothetical protein